MVASDPRDEGCLCQGCGRRYRVDLRLTDEMWKRIQYPDWPNLLCGICIMERIEQLREFDYYDLVHGSVSDNAPRRNVSHNANPVAPPEKLWVQLTPLGGTISHLSDPRYVHDNGKPVYVYVRVREGQGKYPNREEIDRSIKIVSRWIDDIERTNSDA